ncbi:spore coat protein GerQ [Bacillus sp. Marseille-P3661]|uniref:spore coat protein GerQ n=1 Tax=Bacillus sp. Marseille-P3661 TaxID=1936234 RepID=UPI0015E19FDD|nr:spore coat protein GerQ [Bacillus sp. Marseille-P3661]
MANYNPYQAAMPYGQYGYPQYGFQPQAQPFQYPAGSQIPGAAPTPSAQTPVTATSPATPGMLPVEQSYIENILRLNKGKLATVYATFENNTEWNARIFRGIIEAAGRDHLILSDPQTGMRYLIPMIYLDYVTFDEEIEYEYPFTNGPGMATFQPR